MKCPHCGREATVNIQTVQCIYVTYHALLDGDDIRANKEDFPIGEGDSFQADGCDWYYCSECNEELTYEEAFNMLREATI